MNEKQYVDAVMGKITCSRRRKQEFQKQLLADIRLRLEEGEERGSRCISGNRPAGGTEAVCQNTNHNNNRLCGSRAFVSCSRRILDAA